MSPTSRSKSSAGGVSSGTKGTGGGGAEAAESLARPEPIRSSIAGGKHASLRHPPSDLIGGEWVALGGVGSMGVSLSATGKKKTAGAGFATSVPLTSRNPARPDEQVWTGTPRLEHVGAAVAAARKAFPAWVAWGKEGRIAVLRRFAELSKARAGAVAEMICDETGKVMWEAKGEASALASKVDITLDSSPIGGLKRVEGYQFEMGPGKLARAWFRPHGVMAVVGPFNFPAHLPNGHIVPALAMGNTVVFKPSEKTPGVGQALVELFAEALEKEGAPDKGRGIINLVQGGADIASALVSHEDVDGVLFTGSWPVGRRIMEANLDRPGRIIALELGGNNPVVVMPDADLRQAAIEIVRCAFNTTGQRCTCTRRVIVHKSIADKLTFAIIKATEGLTVGDPRAAGVFMGPIISDAARRAVLDFQAKAVAAGAESLVECEAVATPSRGYFIRPGVLRVKRFSAGQPSDTGSPGAKFDPGCDVEVFGPLLRISTTDSFDDAVEQANATRYGLAASIFTTNSAARERFMFECRAGCINVNTGTAGASGKLPFGGLGHSGNHRPAGSFSLDYCAHPVAGMFEERAAAQVAEGMKWDDGWAR